MENKGEFDPVGLDYEQFEVLAGEVFRILAESGTYGHVTLQEVNECVLAAFMSRKALVWLKNCRLVGFMTWAALTPQAAVDFMTHGVCPRGDDYRPDEGEMYVIDFVVDPKDGDTRAMVKEARTYFGARYGDGTVFQWKRDRRSNGFKLGYAIAREKKDGMVQ